MTSDIRKPPAANTSERIRAVSDLPGPEGIPILGNAWQIDPSKARRQFERWAAEHGTPFRLKLGPKQVVVWDSHHVAQQLMRDRPERFRRGGRISEVLDQMRIGGLFAAEGAAWLPQRRMVMQALNGTHFPAFFPVMRTIALRLHRRLARLSDEDHVVDLLEELTGFTVDTVCALAFGSDPDTMEQGPDRIQQHLKKIFPIFMKRLLAPLPYWNWFKLPQDRALDAALDEVHGFVRGLIDHARQEILANPARPATNLLQSMLMAQSHASAQGGDARSLSDDAIAANVLTLLLAGEDTTAHSLAWSIPRLCADTALQEELAVQASTLMGQDVVCADYGTLKHFDLFEAVVTESQRLQPVVGMLSFTPTSTTVLDGVELTPDCIAYFITGPAMVDASNFHDPLRFDPRRWLERREGIAHEPRAFVQFGAGPRVCPGRHLASVQMRLVLTTLLRNFRIELACAPDAIEEINAFTVMPSQMPVRLRPRR